MSKDIVRRYVVLLQLMGWACKHEGSLIEVDGHVFDVGESITPEDDKQMMSDYLLWMEGN